MPPEEKDEIENLKHTLYSRGKKLPHLSDIRTPLSQSEAEAPVSWPSFAEASDGQDKTPPSPLSRYEEKKGMSLPAKFLLGSIGFFVLAAGAAAYMFFGGGNIISPQNIDIQIIAPSLIDSGKEQAFQIIITNRNSSALTLADLVLDYPDGTRDPKNQTKTLQHERQSIGTIEAGQQIKRTASAVLYGPEGTPQKILATLEYSVANSNAVFQKQSETDFLIGSSPVSLSINAPTEAVANETFTVNVTVSNNSTNNINNVVVQSQYPFGYSFGSASPRALTGGNFWKLGTLAPGASQVIHLTGSLDGADGDTRVFRFIVGSNADQTDTTVKVPLLTVPQTLTVRKPFISGTISINGQTGKTISVSAGQSLQGTIQWQNNLSTSISDVQLIVSLSGPALDKNSVSSASGFYQSQNSAITWSPSQDPSLASVAPGGGGTLQFAFATLPPGAGGVLITNPTVTVNLTVQGTRTGEDNVPQTVSSAAQTQVSIASAVSIAAQAFHFSGLFSNSGPMPPKAESDTSYTIVWTVKNASSEIANATVQTVLPPYIRFLSAGNSTVSYDNGSRTITWTLGNVKAGVGYTLSAQTAAFQVVLTPSISQVGSAPALTGAAQLQGQDRFAQVTVQSNAQAPTTQLVGDAGFQNGMDVVAPK
ncbi:MAG: hypothetical protein Q7R71_01755 [bacterium]|nr:hypothetical protein [bacterium]